MIKKINLNPLRLKFAAPLTLATLMLTLLGVCGYLLYISKLLDAANQRIEYHEQTLTSIKSELQFLRYEVINQTEGWRLSEVIKRFEDIDAGRGDVPPSPKPAPHVLKPQQPTPAFGGIGILFMIKSDGIYIEKVFPGSPAEKSGLYQGDKILGIDGLPIKSSDPQHIVERIRGASGTTVTLTYTPSGALNVVKEVTVVRENIDPQKLNLKAGSGKE